MFMLNGSAAELLRRPILPASCLRSSSAAGLDIVRKGTSLTYQTESDDSYRGGYYPITFRPE
jgi:hypothetical protein